MKSYQWKSFETISVGDDNVLGKGKAFFENRSMRLIHSVMDAKRSERSAMLKELRDGAVRVRLYTGSVSRLGGNVINVDRETGSVDWTKLLEIRVGILRSIPRVATQIIHADRVPARR